MTPKKAIEILGMAIPDPDSVSALDMIDAMQLGIEALKRLVWERRYGTLPSSKLLPGETEEINAIREPEATNQEGD